MTRSISLCFASIAVAAALLAASSAQAGRPLQTEDADVLERSACEIEGVAQRLRAAGATATAQDLGWACGIGVLGQVGLNLGTARAGGTRETSIALLGKGQLWRGAGDAAPALTLAWGLGASAVAGASHRHATSELKLVFSQPLAGQTLHLNLGHLRDQQARQTSTGWAVALEHPGFETAGIKWAPMGEILGDDRGDTSWNLALRATLVPERLSVDASFGRQLRGDKGRLLTLGFKVSF